MRLTFEIVLDRSREDVWRAFDSPENLKKWQPSLVSFEPVSGTPGQVGAVSKLTYQEDGRTIELTETITSRREPEEFSGTYDSSSSSNTIRNTFSALDEQRTRWVIDTEFQFSGAMRFMGPIMKGPIQKRFQGDIDRFKELVDSHQL